MAWLLTARPDAVAACPAEASGLVAAVRAAASVSAAESLPLAVGRVQVPLAALVRVEMTDTDQDEIRLFGDFSRFDGLGTGMVSGRLVVEGSTGHRTAADLVGGSVEIAGSCGNWAGVGMKGGRLTVAGDAGDWLGANWPGESRGMTGGEILVTGRVGDHAGVRMRRGLIAVGGDAGAGLARAMIAGSVFVAGHVAAPVGIGMKRGTVVLAEHAANAVPKVGFVEADTFRPLTLDMQFRYAAAAGWGAALAFLRARKARRWLGDTLALGQGEAFVLADFAP